MSRKTLKQIIFWCLIVLLICIAILCALKISKKFVNDAQDKRNNDQLQSMKENVEGPTLPRPTIPDEPIIIPDDPQDEITEPTVPEPIVESDILLEYRALYELNNDMVGWLEIEGTSINYPVVQTPNSPNFYLRRDFYKQSATCGTIYAREVCDINKPSTNVTLYGHNMRNGTMFADLHLFKDKSFWKEHRYVYFDTLTEKHVYEIFSVFQTTADLAQGFSYHLFSDTKDAAKFFRFVDTCKELSLYDTGISPTYGEKLLTLSTCDKSIEDGRFVVVCRRLV